MSRGWGCCHIIISNKIKENGLLIKYNSVLFFIFFGIKKLNKAYKLIVYDSAYLQGEGLLSLI